MRWMTRRAISASPYAAEPAAARWRSESDSTYLLKQLDLTPAARRAGSGENVNLNACKGRAVQVDPRLTPG